MSNRELKVARDEALKYKGERDAESREFERVFAMYKKKEAEALAAQKSHAEALARIAELEKTVDEKQTQNKTLELLSQDYGDDCKWLLTPGVPLLANRLVRSEELAKYMFELGGAARNNGCKDGYAEGKATAKEGALLLDYTSGASKDICDSDICELSTDVIVPLVALDVRVVRCRAKRRAFSVDLKRRVWFNH
ncbi:hypothetical protein Hanom_Chr05g00432831 [Helianthus anomalus]